MSRLPSSAPAIGNGHINVGSTFEQKAKWSSGSRSASYSKFSDTENTLGSLNPDDLFTKYGVAEVKLIQQRLRADALSKQEELRLMVGERYRDLLKASTSIISIAESSQRVQQSLQETKEEILSQKVPSSHQAEPSSRDNDVHLNTLQLLSAHMKLLLDAPEHLWRLLEHKKYLYAMWLFLLTRVVYRSLIRQDEQDKESWSGQGIDVLVQFPLIKRQWDAIAQFRSQIISKATLSLREESSSAEDLCSALLTLHFLDSRPLSETLSVFLTQRSKSLQSRLSLKKKIELPSSLSRMVNGHTSKKTFTQPLVPEHSGKTMGEIEAAIHAPLDTIFHSIKVAKEIFQEEGFKLPLIRLALLYIQSDSFVPPDAERTLPKELYLTTQLLLVSLPSSAHFQLLPQTLKSYRPHVELTSPSTSIDQTHFRQKMNEWFQQTTSLFQPTLKAWLIELQTVKAVWGVRSSTRDWILGSGLDKSELVKLTRGLDEACQHRVNEIWQHRLDKSLRLFESHLDSSLSPNADLSTLKHPPLAHLLFRAPPLPTHSHSSLSSINTFFQSYKASLGRQLMGRAPLLDEVLTALESCARSVREDLVHVMESSHDAQTMVRQMEDVYKTHADTLCINVAVKLEQVAQSGVPSTSSLMFLARLATKLMFSSPFVSEISCRKAVAEEFRKRVTAVYEGVIDRWRNGIISQIVRAHRAAYRPPQEISESFSIPSNPSASLIESLLSLSSSIQEKGASSEQSPQSFIQDTFSQFISELTGDGWSDHSIQSVYDLAFLKKLVDIGGDGCDTTDASLSLRKRIKTNLPKAISEEELNTAISESLVRMQNLLTTLVPRNPPLPILEGTEKLSRLLPYGHPPPSDPQFQPAIELAKPTPRFSLLLVTS